VSEILTREQWASEWEVISSPEADSTHWHDAYRALVLHDDALRAIVEHSRGPSGSVSQPVMDIFARALVSETLRREHAIADPTALLAEREKEIAAVWSVIGEDIRELGTPLPDLVAAMISGADTRGRQRDAAEADVRGLQDRLLNADLRWNTAEARVAALEKIIEQAPHDIKCLAFNDWGIVTRSSEHCDCWKAALRDGAGK